MLVLTRKTMECIQIGNNVIVKVLEIRGNKVRIGIDAPKNIQVMRSELPNLISPLSNDITPSTSEVA